MHSLIKYLTTRLNIRKFHSIVDSKASDWLRVGLSLLYLTIKDCKDNSNWNTEVPDCGMAPNKPDVLSQQPTLLHGRMCSTSKGEEELSYEGRKSFPANKHLYL